MAITILGIATSGLLLTASQCLAVIKKARFYETARHLVGRVDLEDPLLVKIFNEEFDEGTDSGTFDDMPYGWKWQRTISRVGEEEEGLYEVKIRVSWSESGKTSYEEVVTMVSVPELVEGGVL